MEAVERSLIGAADGAMPAIDKRSAEEAPERLYGADDCGAELRPHVSNPTTEGMDDNAQRALFEVVKWMNELTSLLGHDELHHDSMNMMGKLVGQMMRSERVQFSEKQSISYAERLQRERPSPPRAVRASPPDGADLPLLLRRERAAAARAAAPGATPAVERRPFDLPKRFHTPLAARHAAMSEQHMPAVSQRVVDALRVLCVDMVEHAQCGHPGMPMGMAPAAFVLWERFLRFDPQRPQWFNRDRFVLSAGHGCALQYALLHLYGAPALDDVQQLRNFRRAGSLTPGHPESGVTPGVEVTTGPLGQGVSNAVGLALAEKQLAARFNVAGCAPVVDHRTYCIVGDGCLMEGVASEACALAGHWGLGKLIVLYDDNAITIDGGTHLAFSEDVTARFQSYGWQVLEVMDGNEDLTAIDRALGDAVDEVERPTLMRIATTIGFGAPLKAGLPAAHGAPLGGPESAALRAACGYAADAPPFEAPADVLCHTRARRRVGARCHREWLDAVAQLRAVDAPLHEQFERQCIHHSAMEDGAWRALVREFVREEAEKVRRGAAAAEATRVSAGRLLQRLSCALPQLIGGAADLAASTNAKLAAQCGEFQRDCALGRQLHFGVREHAMAAICNGLALHGSGLIPFCSTFLVFSDYMRAGIRLSALSHAGVLYVLSHDSVLLGQDGPTHQPVEQLASLRAMPGIDVWRPCHALEVAAAYESAVEQRARPSLLALSRQKLNAHGARYEGARRGAYVIFPPAAAEERGDGPRREVHAVVIATGSEVELAVGAASRLAATAGGPNVVVVSMPCVELFERQEEAYRRRVLQADEVPRSRTLVVEAGSSSGWYKYAEQVAGVDEFGLSGDADFLALRFGLTVDNVVSRVQSLTACRTRDELRSGAHV